MMQRISMLPRSPRPLLRPAFWRLSPSHFCRALATQVKILKILMITMDISLLPRACDRDNNGFDIDAVLGRLVSRWSLAGSLDRQQGSGAQGGRGYHRYHCHWYYCDYWFAYKRRRSRCLRLSSSLAQSSRLLSWFKDYHIYQGVDGWNDYYPNYDDYDYDWSRLAMREVLKWATCSIVLEANKRAAPLDVPEVSEVVDHHHQPKFLVTSRIFCFNPLRQ